MTLSLSGGHIALPVIDCSAARLLPALLHKSDIDKRISGNLPGNTDADI